MLMPKYRMRSSTRSVSAFTFNENRACTRGRIGGTFGARGRCIRFVLETSIGFFVVTVLFVKVDFDVIVMLVGAWIDKVKYNRHQSMQYVKQTNYVRPRYE